MRIPKHDIPVRIDVPGAVARQLPTFGTPSGEMGAEYFVLGAGTDIAPLLKGLDHDLCPSPHWGYVINGSVTVTYGDGSTEQCITGDLFHWPGGHTVRVEIDAELVLFSPCAEHEAVIDHMSARLAGV